MAVAALVAGAMHAAAVSGGGYSYQQQGCSTFANRNDWPGTEPGCHNWSMQLNQGAGPYAGQWHAFAFNLDQLRNGDFPHSGSVTVDPGQGTSYTVRFETGTARTVGFFPLGWAADIAGWVVQVFQTHQLGGFPIPHQPIPPTASTPGVGVSQGGGSGGLDSGNPGNWQLYLGADDNLDNGEHDSVNPNPDPRQPNRDARVSNGPSDGGALQLNVHPQGSLADPVPFLAWNLTPTDLHNPIPLLDFGLGACADGVCAAADTTRRQVYQGGCHTCAPQDVYSDQSTTDWRSPDCNSGDVSSQNDCGTAWNTRGGSEKGPITQPFDERGAYYTEPGVMIYEDPDPQASPILPLYPLCEEYVGTQGVYVCGKPATSGASTVPLRAQSVPAAPAPPPPAPRRSGAPVLAPGIASAGIR
jgi:hypothetical protein